jgi:DNA-binding XRE family transcriptional regulator
MSDVMCTAADVACERVVMTLALSERDRERLSLFVDEMRAMRAEHGWSRAELAAQAQYSESLIAMVETYQRAPTQSLAKALDRAFQTPGFTDPVMHDQLIRLVEMSRWPHITIQVVPYTAGGHSGLLGAFIIAELPAAQSIVFMEDVSGGRVAEGGPELSEAAMCFEALRSEALPKSASRDLIAKVAKERWTA